MALAAKLPTVFEEESREPRDRGSDASILRGLEQREAWAADALFTRVESAVERSLYRVLQQRSTDFEDLVQVTFERIVRTLVERRFAAQCSLVTWASAIATNVAIDSVRAKMRERRIFGAEPLEVADRDASAKLSGTDRVETRADVKRLQQILAEMNPEQAQAVYLHDALGHDLVEIAAISGVSVAAAQSRLVRGRKDFLRRAKRANIGGQTP